ncbi:helix-turn-helix domain-containing protein [Actinomadura sp. 21ATH]|uniref:helix-turn-helix domain-containing protein n=1 Tax=Actinomadura sp. 21ATH TaxID=1735444 RepID=UPI0035BEFCEA
MDARTELSQFLRSRRARLRPEDVGLVGYGARRRVPGLRREELAQLAGVSVTHYTRLEQGQRLNVSTEILDAIADALRLSQNERAHLHRLVRPGEPGLSGGAGEAALVRPNLLGLLDSMVLTAAVLIGRYTEILAWNRLADELTGGLDDSPGRRTASHWLFLGPNARPWLGDSWKQHARANVALLRSHLARYPGDERLRGHIAVMRVQSPQFERMWQEHEVEEWSIGDESFVMDHPVVGVLELDYQRVLLPDEPGLGLLLYSARPGTAARERLQRLAARATPDISFG